MERIKMADRPAYDPGLQYLTVAYAKDVGLDSQGKAIRFDPDETDYLALGLTPALIVAVVHPLHRIYRRWLVSPLAPKSISELLADAWSERGLLCIPKMLEVKRSVLQADRGFADWVRKQGVGVRICDEINRIGAFERGSLDIWSAINWDQRSERPVPLSRANNGLFTRDSIASQCLVASSNERFELENWMTTRDRFCCIPAIANDWEPEMFPHPAVRRPIVELAVDSPGEDVGQIDAIANVANMWPGGRRKFLEDMEVSKRDFDFWLKGRSHLPGNTWALLEERLNVQQIDDDLRRMEGGYLLIATSTRDVLRTYEELSHGGDLSLAAEVVGPNGESAPMRFLVFQACGCPATIILFERDGRSECLLDGDRLINIGTPIQASDEVWESVLKIIEYRESFKEPWAIGESFEVLHHQDLCVKPWSQRW